MTITAKPILFSAPMIKALLREIANPGTGKTQTRRIMKAQPTDTGVSWQFDLKGRKSAIWANYPYDDFDDKENGLVGYCPYGKPGDLLYVRETYAEVGTCDPGWLLYRASGYKNECRRHGFAQCPDESEMKWTPSIHMPRWASRITLEVTDVRVQRLQDISEEDAKAEGVYRDEDRPEEHDYRNNEWMCPKCAGTLVHDDVCPATLGVIHDVDCYECDTSKQKFQHLWTSINGPESWSRNDWVWAVSFKPHLINVDRFIEERVA